MKRNWMREGEGRGIQAGRNVLMRSLEGEGNWPAGEMDWRSAWLECSERGGWEGGVGGGKGEEGEEGEKGDGNHTWSCRLR